MLTSKMYKLETLAQIYRSKYNVNDANQLYSVYNLSNKHITSIDLKNLESLDYIAGALSIPYPVMLELINHYKNTGYYERQDMWSYALSQEYNLPERIVIQRFYSVERLSKSLIYKKKMEELYSIDTNIKNKVPKK